jgi:hypothetical protein
MREEYAARMLYLILIELAEIIHIHVESLGIYDSSETIEFDLVILQILDCDDHIRQFADTGWFDQDPVWIILFDDFIKSFAEIPYECTADAARNHLIDLDPGFSQESRIHTDLTELILNKNDVLVLVTFSYEFLDQCRFACSKEARKNIDFSHLCIISLPETAS